MLFILGIIVLYIIGIFLASPLIKFSNRNAKCANDRVSHNFAYLSVVTIFIIIAVEIIFGFAKSIIFLFTFQPFKFIHNYVNKNRWQKNWKLK